MEPEFKINELQVSKL